MSQFSQFNDPASSDFIDFNDVNGALLLFTVYEETDEHVTAHGPNTAVIADIVVLDGNTAGTTYSRAYIYPKGLKPQLRNSIGGGMVLGRLGQGPKQPGKNAPWTLAAANDAEKQIAQKWVDGHGHPAEVRAEREAQQSRPF
jgi:hypothetical protein